MGLPWVRLDTSLPSNPKLLHLLAQPNGHRTALVFILGLTYAGAHETAGFLPAGALPFLHAKRSDADKLCQVGFWGEVDGGWEIHDWADFQPVSLNAEARRTRAQKAAAARWGHG